MIYFIVRYYLLSKEYRKKVNPDYPILPNEASDYFSKNPAKYLKMMPIMPFKQWGIVFQKHSDKELNSKTKSARLAFFGMIIVIFSSFVISIILDINR